MGDDGFIQVDGDGGLGRAGPRKRGEGKETGRRDIVLHLVVVVGVGPDQLWSGGRPVRPAVLVLSPRRPADQEDCKTFLEDLKMFQTLMLPLRDCACSI